VVFTGPPRRGPLRCGRCSMKSESLARGGVVTMTSVDNLDDGTCCGGVCAVCVCSQVGRMCPQNSRFLTAGEGSCDL
jgi:hypothetical protein